MWSEAGCLSVTRAFQFSWSGILRFLNEEVMSAQIDRVKGKAGALRAGPFFSLAGPLDPIARLLYPSHSHLLAYLVAFRQSKKDLG